MGGASDSDPLGLRGPGGLAQGRTRCLCRRSSGGALLDWLSSPAAGLDDTGRNWCQGLDRALVSPELARLGANVIGHFCYPSGLRVSVESMVQAMGRVGVSTSLRDVRTDAKDDPHHVDYRGMEVYDVTIIHTQPEPFFDVAYARANLYERQPRTYRIGYWYWEFDSIPDSWVAQRPRSTKSGLRRSSSRAACASVLRSRCARCFRASSWRLSSGAVFHTSD